MKRSELTEFAVEEEGFKLKIRRGYNGLPVVSTSHGASPAASLEKAGSPAPGSPSPAAPAPNVEAEEAGVSYIKSPMVFTFYQAATPESKPFVDSGSKVAETTVVCIIEAMKIM